ncbi:hypothetical protein I6F36_24415 [Bradyrhizobium sp. BRP19]|uniref:hypothetical protein n=1 Tax=Bradyrhizobium sp. BRP19 TaxID=2793823 RepID=UPI001CD75B0E|nr:hypothetical protein [Bradyrhizobium sp. BRP19]MCA1549980.1 hypothetical protein [Bradyrhizobium sp. BRP19]
MGLALLTLSVGIIALFTALAFLLLRAPTTADSSTGEQALAPVEASSTSARAGGAGCTLIAAAGIGVLWFFVWKLSAITLQYLFVSGNSSRAFPIVPLSFAISIAAMCVVVLFARHFSK